MGFINKSLKLFLLRKARENPKKIRNQIFMYMAISIIILSPFNSLRFLYAIRQTTLFFQFEFVFINDS